MQDDSKIFLRAIRRGLSAIALSGALVVAAGCHSNSVAASGPDPAEANLAPVNGQQGQPQVMGQQAAYSPQQQGENYPQQPQQQGGYYPQQQAPAPIQQGYPQQGYSPSDSEYAGEEALAETNDPPPPLPEYDQPPAPGPDYIWTPGYWAWGGSGYYWVPGAWVEAPYYGALWTPPYWGWYGGHYRFHHGYWGRHVGYYGGIDYGFGYIGLGYFGGYWNGNNFYYNRAVTHVGGGIRNVYERPVMYNNVRYSGQPSNRVSYNGGRGGINVQPRPAEVAAMRERHDPATPVQRQMSVQASQNRSQFFAENRGRPAEASVARGFANTGGIGPARGAEPGRVAPGVTGAQPNRFENRAGQPQPNAAPNRFENRGAQPQPNAAPNRFENRGAQPQPNAAPNRFENRGAQPQPNAAPNRFENRGAQPQPQPRAEVRPQPQPQPRAEVRSQPQPRVESRPMPAPQARPQAAPQARPQPAPQARPQAAPQAHQAPAPQAHGGGGGHPDDHGHH